MTERRTKPRRDEDKFPYYRYYPRDLASDGPVITMSLLAEGAYKRLLDYQWLNGAIPADTAKQAMICKGLSPRVMKTLWAQIAPCFVDQGDGTLKNGKMERIRGEMVEAHNRRVNAGKAGGNATSNARGNAPANGVASEQLAVGSRQLAVPEQPQHTLTGRAEMLMSKLQAEPDRWAVVEFLEHVPRSEAWTANLDTMLSGPGMPNGTPATPAALVLTCRQFLTKHPSEINPRFFGIACEKNMESATRPTGGKSSRLAGWTAPQKVTP